MPLTVSVVVQPNTTTSIDAVVESMSVLLARVVVQAPSGELLRLPFGVADRFRHGMGHYITAGDIEKQGARETADLFRGIAGLEITGRPGSRVVRNTRGSSSLIEATDNKGNHRVSTSCDSGMSVFLNGAPADGNIDVVAPSEIEAIEIYKDAVETPVTLSQSPCGVIYIWTK
ncbi:MAG: TonB-dependent receptor plug domain-containing protein [Gemmatimonadota bacterium]|nr:TonB-dependent receptor plug domain-containing protein [Gemmatimonadota bacterium]